MNRNPSPRHVRLSLVRATRLTILVLVLTVLPGTTAVADVTYYPADRNGEKVYLSESCHDRGSGSCQPRRGCDDFSENYWSSKLAYSALRNDPWSGLLERGYIVRIGDGLTSNNISNSNNWGSTMHIPLHSNARDFACGTSDNSYGGTWPLYVSNNDKQLAYQLRYAIAPDSPGTNDKIVYRSDLGELNQTNMPAAYMESEFHTWMRGVRWLRQPSDWSWRIGYGVDRCRGYPRDGRRTGEKRCDW